MIWKEKLDHLRGLTTEIPVRNTGRRHRGLSKLEKLERKNEGHAPGDFPHLWLTSSCATGNPPARKIPGTLKWRT
jgi:hypothetical protein